MALSNYCIVQDSWWNHKRSPIPWLILSIWFIFTLWSTRQSCVFMSGLLPLLFMNLAIASLRLLCNDIFGTRTAKSCFCWDLWHITRVCRTFLGVLVKACVTLMLFSGICAAHFISWEMKQASGVLQGLNHPYLGLHLLQLCMHCYKGHSLSPHSLPYLSKMLYE